MASLRRLLVVLVLVLGVPGGATRAQSDVTLHVTVLDFESADGLAGIAVWGSAEGFPEEIEHAVATRYVEIADGAPAAEFAPLPAAPGVYAVTVFHDKNWLGMPREAWGVSNNARPRLLAPRFDEARLELAAGPHAIEIRVD